MRVGILTYHHTTNFGATLQAYALGQYVESLGHKVEFIDYRPIKAVLTYFKALYLNKSFISNYKKSQKMKNFVNSELKLGRSTMYFKPKSNSSFEKYDIVICGSDEIWNINSFRGFDSTYFLDIGNVKKASYAVSTGFTTSLGEKKEIIKGLLNNFDNISVRDNNTKAILEKECGIVATKVLDPTFLGEYDGCLTTPKERDYIFIYGHLNSVEEARIKELAKKQGLLIISVGYYNKIANKNVISASPNEFLGYIKHSNYVFTNFFHGVLFSIIFRKQFYALKRKDKMNKVEDILRDLNLENRIIDASSDIVLNSSKINYEFIEDLIIEKLTISKDFIKKVLM